MLRLYRTEIEGAGHVWGLDCKVVKFSAHAKGQKMGVNASTNDLGSRRLGLPLNVG